jgi:anti-anti-sigma factor
MLQIQSRELPPDIVVLEIAGRITIGRDCKQLEWARDGLVRENRKKIIFDLTGVTHIDSTGVGIIVMSAGQVKNAGGALRRGRRQRTCRTSAEDDERGPHFGTSPDDRGGGRVVLNGTFAEDVVYPQRAEHTSDHQNKADRIELRLKLGHALTGAPCRRRPQTSGPRPHSLRSGPDIRPSRDTRMGHRCAGRRLQLLTE